MTHLRTLPYLFACARPGCDPARAAQGKQLAAPPTRTLRIRVEPAPPAAAAAGSLAKRLLTGVTVRPVRWRCGPATSHSVWNPAWRPRLTARAEVLVRRVTAW